MKTIAAAKKAVGMLSLMKFFPGDEDFRGALMELLDEMCTTDEQMLWLARRTRNLYAEWPGAHELRAVLCTKFKPRDGVDAYSGVYVEGIPSETGEWERLNREAQALPGGTSSLDQGVNALVAEAVQGVKTLPPARKPVDAKGAEKELAERALAKKEIA